MPNPNEQFNTAKRINAYENATRMLAQRVANIKMPDGFKPIYDMKEMVYAFRFAFKNPQLRADVLLGKNEAERLQKANFSSGFCGIASYTWNQIFRMPDGSPIWDIYQYANPNDTHALKHHVWLKHRLTGEILDLTFDQSVNCDGDFVEIPYHLGKRISSNFAFKRAFVFGDYIGVDVRKIALQNALRSYE